ncbi:hypothetical protein DFQ28_010266 [Apophysomyces sp. BC1034]|nr:hypothetical protein DFQ30_009276 [Apophysomyces sp. BC1015]KAG0171601.1 hypothetical protein DFQ29_008763 [Apophysomyces sp. BC1021]KAG0184904.1 hypothetical protein DFQ28_010266 [Apophysomyces sp. BC1034]
MSNDLYLEWTAVQDGWFQQYHNHDVSAFRAVQEFFNPNNFFLESSPTVGIILHAGTRPNGEWAVLINPHTCLRLRQLLAEHLLRTVGDSVPYPVEHKQARAYRDIKAGTITDKNVYQRWLRNVSKANKTRERMSKATSEWKQAKSLVQGKQYVLFSIDIEAWEQDHSILLEIGWTMYDTRHDQYMDQHYLVNTYRHLQNGKYVDDQKLRFQFGTSVWCTLKQTLEELKKDLDWATQRDGGFVLVGHGLESDLKYLAKQKFLWPGRAGEMDTIDVEKSALVVVLNTDTIYGASISDLHNPPSLGKTLSLLNIEHWCMHNAGNDAHYTMELLMALVGKCPDN